MTPALECPVCESQKFKSLFAVKGADVVQCCDCDLIYVPAPLPEVTSIYKASYFKGDHKVHGYGNYENEFENHYKTFSHRLKSTEELMSGKGRVLDVGCALGHFGKVAKDRGWDTFVTDVSDFAVQTAAVKYGLKGFVSSPNKLPVKDHQFDCVTLFDVIEHVSHPIDLLKNVHQAMDANGFIHITTPDVSSWSARLMGKSWYHFKPEEHLLYFTPKTLTAALDKAGFEVVRITPMPMFMRVKDIFARLRRYSERGANLCLKICQFLGVADLTLKIYAGEMEAWARPKAEGSHPAEKRLPKARPVSPHETPVSEVVCCPNCRGDLAAGDGEILCTDCDSSYGIEAGVIDFSRYGKKHQKGARRRASGY
jgi:2-polyprenyl-3-methyl-5-hydroxy-6-metoxy-1,4-benzoquinol methylase